ncbi:hypothetical protein PISMIDRAFT_684548 [Pisolithus microcarpus 441]|uniref:Uncharacterized protein n=1 Tax=Pisolithus microcarpus 441 TaxID=765257 RepID=A0A0C9Z6Q5_9AGAM|nr:hypothetical protein BKA83DRAFT_684548 [Pisolithus microcarpus]KIK18107.1 hypothetical protein PISMIDRAFT_684548 [Pisolithus microcarpus 441]
MSSGMFKPMPSDNPTCAALSVVVVVITYRTCCSASNTKDQSCDVSFVLL